MSKLSRTILQRNLFQFFQHCKRNASENSKQVKTNDSSSHTTNDSAIIKQQHEASASESHSEPFKSTALYMSRVIPGKGLPPEPPTNCCMSGCSNCVWIKYVEELSDYYKDGGDMAKEAIEQIPDETIRAFLRMSL